MKKFTRNSIRLTLAVTLLVGSTAFFIFTLVGALWYSPNTEISVPTMAAATSTPVNPEDYPKRLIIPSINVSAGIQYVGINVKGSMANPSNFTDVGWYKYGTVPGQRGSAVIAGHLDNALALNGVFKHLDELKKGDDLYIQTKGGARLHFNILDIEVYPYNDAPKQRIFADNGGTYLNLITCSGTWIPKLKTYDQRRVIYSQLIQGPTAT